MQFERQKRNTQAYKYGRHTKERNHTGKETEQKFVRVSQQNRGYNYPTRQATEKAHRVMRRRGSHIF
jgi:hypothetical protein